MLYNYYYLALQTWCTPEYKIHGLWADITPTTYPSYCTDVPFDLDKLKQSPKYDAILEAWSDCTYEDTITLYEHEWAKHGTCISGLDQNGYFEKTLELYQEYGYPACFDLDFNKIDCLEKE